MFILLIYFYDWIKLLQTALTWVIGSASLHQQWWMCKIPYHAEFFNGKLDFHAILQNCSHLNSRDFIIKTVCFQKVQMCMFQIHCSRYPDHMYAMIYLQVDIIKTSYFVFLATYPLLCPCQCQFCLFPFSLSWFPLKKICTSSDEIWIVK